MTEYFPILVALLAVYLLVAGSRFGVLSVSSLFMYSQFIMASGVLPLLQPNIPADEMHLHVVLGTFAVMTFTSCAYAIVFARSSRRAYAPQVSFSYPPRATWIVIAVAAGVSLLYYISIGYFAFFESLEALVAGESEDIAGLRLQSYAGSSYFFPGYVNQFKNGILPALTLVIVLAAYHFRVKGRHVLAVTLIVFSLVMLLGTGQRAPIVRTLIFVIVALYLISRRTFHKAVPLVLFGGLGIFFIATFATGRAASDLAAATGTFDAVGVFFDQTMQRIFGSSQLSAVVGFRYVSTQETQLGADWLQSIVGLLPGQSGSTVANEVFAIMYGSTRGTAPLSIWGSTYFNFGFVGTLLFACVLAVAFAAISTATNRLQQTNLIELGGLAGIAVAFGMWISEGPTTPLNAGLPAYLVLWLWGRSLRRAARHVDSSTAPLSDSLAHSSVERRSP